MPSLLDSANPQKINQEPLDFKMSKGSLLQPIHSVVIPNYDADLAAKYMNNPVFNTIDPNKGYIQMENDMAQGQSALEQWGRGVTKGVAGIPLKFLEGMGYVYGFGKWGLKDGFDVKDVDSFINNDFATYFKSLSEDVNRSLPIYSSFDYSQGNFLQKTKTAKFWANDAIEGLSFLASAYGGSFIGKGIGALGGEIAGAVGASTNAAAKVSKYAAYAGGTTYNVLMEGGMEAKGLYDSVLPELEELEFQKLKEKNTDAFGNLMADEKFLMQEASKIAKEKAGQAAVNTFVGNIGILLLSNSIEMKAFLGNPADDMRKLFRKTVKGEISAAEISAWKEFGKGALTGLVSEGLWEEGMQHAVESYQHKKALGKVNLNEGGFTGGYFKEWLKGWSTTEGQASMFLGALIGAPTQGIGALNEAKEKQKTVKYFENIIDKEKESILASDKIYESFLKERELKDEKGKHVFDENGKITLNVDWMKDKAHQILLDEEYVNEKVDAVLRGDIPAATMVDQFYKSRKLWRYLASPLYANSDEAFDAFKKSFQTQADEHFAYSQQVASERQVTVEDPVITQNRLTAEKKEHDVQVQQALIEAQMMKNEFDNLQKNIKIDFFDPNAKAINEKLSKALFYEANKRKGLEKILADPSLSEENRTVITEMISASQELTNKLYNVKEREKYISTTTAVDEEIIAKQKEIQEIKNKYKEPIENSKNTKSTLEKIKDKGKEIVAPITSKMGIDNSLKSEPAKKETPKKEVPLEEKISKEDKLKILKLNHDIERLFYQHGDSYLSRINKEYGGQSYLGKKHQYLKERGDIEIYKENIKDQLQEIQVQITELLESGELFLLENFNQVENLFKEYVKLLENFAAKYIPVNGGILNNFTAQDYEYAITMQKDLLKLLEDWKKNISSTEKYLKEDLESLTSFNAFFEQRFLDNFLENLNAHNFEYENPLFDLGDFSSDALILFGPELLRASAKNNYFITHDDFHKFLIRLATKTLKIDLSDKDALLAELLKIVEENKVITQSFLDSESAEEDKTEALENLLKDFDNLLLEASGQYTFEMQSIDFFDRHFKNLVKSFENAILDIKVNALEKNFKDFTDDFLENAKDNIDQNKFLKNYSKDLENADDFYEHLYIEENPDYQVNYARSIVNKYKKDFFEKNQSELDKIEDLDTYHQILEALKNIDSILESKENDLKEFTKLSKKDIEHFIRVLENHIIPLAIKNQNNRKLVQEVSLNVRDENYFNQLGFNVQINHAGKPVLKSQSQELLKLLSEVLEKDVNSLVESNLIEKFNFLPLEQIIKELSNLPSEKKQKVLDFIKSQKENISEEIRVFENALNEARFKNSIHFDNYLVNPDATIEYIIYELSRYNDISYRTLEEKQNWFSSPLYNYSKHLSPALLLNELNKKKFSGSTALPYEKLVKLLENHLEYTALHNLEKNLNTTLDYTNYFKNLREVLEKSQLSPTYQQEIALREAFEWWNDKKMFLSYLKGVAGTGKTNVFLKYFMDINKISYSNTIFSAHNESATNTLKQISDNAVALTIKELLSKSIDFFEKTNLIVLDEVNANDRTTFLTFLSFVQDINLKRDENNKLKVLFLGDPTQLKATQEQFIALFSKDYTKHAFPFRNYLKIFSPLTVAYRSDVGAINSASNVFRDTNQVITNYTANSSGKISDVNVKGTIVASGIRENGLLKDILQRLNLVKEQAFSKAVIVSTEAEVKAYQDYLTANNVQGVEVLTIENAQGRTFDEVHVDIIKNNLQSTSLGKKYAKDFQYFYNTVLYTAISRAKNTVILFDESATFSQVENDDVLEVSKDLTKEKEELKQKMTEYLDIADEYYKNKIETKPEEKPEEEKPEEKPTPEEEEITEEEEEETDDLEEDVPEVVPGGRSPEEEPIIEGGTPEILDTEDTIVHELQNFQYEVLLEKQGVGNVKNKSDLQPGNEVVYVKSGDGNIYVYFKSENSPNYWTPLTLMYPKNLRESVESEKIIKDALDKNTNKNLIYSLNSIPLTHLSEKDIIARGTIKQSQKLKFHYSAVSNKDIVEKQIENSGGIMEYLKQKLLPLIYKKGSLELEEKATITNFEVFVPTENDKNVLTQMLKNDDPGAAIGVPYIKFDVVRIKENGQKSTKSFFVKMDAPMLHKTDSLIAPVKTFYDSITNLEKELAAIGLSSLKLGNDSFEKLVLAFKNDFTAEVESEKTLSNGKVVEHFKIVPKQNSIVTKEMVFEILKDYNLSDELTSKILAVFQKESKNLIPVLYTAKRKRLKVSPIEYVDFLHEQAALGNISAVDIADYEKLLEDSLTPTGDKIGDSFTEAVYNKREMSVLGTIRAIKSSGLQLEDFENNIRDTVRTIRRSLTEKSFVEIKQGPNKGKYFAFDPLIGRIVVMDKIGPKRFVSPKYAERENIGMTYYSDIQLTKQGGSAQTAFNILARSNDKVYTGEDPEDYFTLRMTRSSKDTGKMMIYAPTLIKENRSEDTFEKKYYYILKKAFDAHIDKLKEAGENYLFELTFKNEEGEDVSLQYNDDIDPKTGKTRWRNEAIIGKLRREYKLQDIELLEKLKALMVNLGVEIPSENGPVKASFELFNEMENNFYKEPMTSKMLSHVVGDQAFDEKTGRSKKYRTNVDKMFLKDSQENKSFEENPLVQSMVTTRFQKVTPSSIQVSLNKPSVGENSSNLTEKETVSETGEVIISSSPEDGFIKTDPDDGTSSVLQDFQPSFVVTKDYVEPLTDIIMEINEFEEDMRNAVQDDINLIIDFESPTFKKLAQSLSKTYGIEVDVLLNDMEGTFRKKICKG